MSCNESVTDETKACMSSCLMPITVRCLPPDVEIQAINTDLIALADEEMICAN